MTIERDNSYVLFPLGEKRFAFPAEMVNELSRPDHPQTFPHNTPLLVGVLVRRGKIVPVLDIAQLLVGPEAPQRKFYLITNCSLDSHQESTAIPVTGECELASLEAFPRQKEQPGYVLGTLEAGDESIAVVDLEKLMAEEARP